MSKLWNMLSVAVIMASAAIGLATSRAQAQTAPVAIGRPVPPRLSHAQAMYLNRHPTELAALKARLPFHRAGEVPVAAPPKKAAAVGGTWTPLSNSFPGAEASAPQCEALLNLALEACEHYYPAFQFVLWGGKSAKDAVDAAVLECAGRA